MPNKLPQLEQLLPSELLSSYLISRLCHDLSSPISAVNNIIELSSPDDLDADLYEILELSAQKISHRLQFVRLAFGAYGAIDSFIDIAGLQKVTTNFLTNEKLKITWSINTNGLNSLKAKLLLNLSLIAANCLPEGGLINIAINSNNILIELHSETICFPQNLLDIAYGKIPLTQINSHTIQNYYSLLLTKDAQATLSIEQATKQLTIVVEF